MGAVDEVLGSTPWYRPKSKVVESVDYNVIASKIGRVRQEPTNVWEVDGGDGSWGARVEGSRELRMGGVAAERLRECEVMSSTRRALESPDRTGNRDQIVRSMEAGSCIEGVVQVVLVAALAQSSIGLQQALRSAARCPIAEQ
jgi:hypothetical protein